MTPTLAVIQLSGSFDFAAVKQLVLDSVSSENSKRVYGQALDSFWAWYQTGPGGPISKAMVNAFKAHLEARGLAPSSINVALSAVRKLVQEAADNGLLAADLAAGVARIKGVARHGRRMGNWLTLLDVKDKFMLSFGIRLIQSHFLRPASTQVWIRHLTGTTRSDKAPRVTADALKTDDRVGGRATLQWAPFLGTFVRSAPGNSRCHLDSLSW